MNPSNFDELTKALANSTSRRHALRVIVTTSLGGLLGLTSVSTAFGRHRVRVNKPSGPKGNSNCAQFCAAVFGANTSAAGQCTSDAAHGRGLCHQCGNVDPSSICCKRTASSFCSGTSAASCPCDSSQCLTCDTTDGMCVSKCLSSQACQNGDCVCVPNCTGKMCGDDNGCGGRCNGGCPGGQICCEGKCCKDCCRGTFCCDTICCGPGFCCRPGQFCGGDPERCRS